MLTKEILCAYAPYGVMVKDNPVEDILTIYNIGQCWICYQYGNLKLLLRPLSSIDLKWFQDNIDPNLEDFRINCEPENNHFSVEVCEKVLGWSALSYDEYQLFLKNHVDIFGLLESGHAIELKEE